MLTGFTAQQIEHGGLQVREKPGPKNSLGLVKFMFPNQYDIYLHSTPQPELFEPLAPRLLPRLHPRAEAGGPRRLGARQQQHAAPADRSWDADTSTTTMTSGAGQPPGQPQERRSRS